MYQLAPGRNPPGPSASGAPAEPGYLVGGPTGQGGSAHEGHPGCLLRRPPPCAQYSTSLHMTHGGPEGWCVCGEDRRPDRTVTGIPSTGSTRKEDAGARGGRAEGSAHARRESYLGAQKGGRDHWARGRGGEGTRRGPTAATDGGEKGRRVSRQPPKGSIGSCTNTKCFFHDQPPLLASESDEEARRLLASLNRVTVAGPRWARSSAAPRRGRR